MVCSYPNPNIIILVIHLLRYPLTLFVFSWFSSLFFNIYRFDLYLMRQPIVIHLYILRYDSYEMNSVEQMRKKVFFVIVDIVHLHFWERFLNLRDFFWGLCLISCFYNATLVVLTQIRREVNCRLFYGYVWGNSFTASTVIRIKFKLGIFGDLIKRKNLKCGVARPHSQLYNLRCN